MLSQIVSHTPVYVWIILALLVYRGIAASRDREIQFGQLFIVPLIMTALSLFGVQSGFGAAAGAPLLWLAGIAAGAALGWRLVAPSRVVVDLARKAILLRGSWLPLALMMAIFCTKYAVAVTLAIAPALQGQMSFVAVLCIAYGMFSGIFIGGMLRHVTVFRRARQAQIA